jgi:hypothetical protein
MMRHQYKKCPKKIFDHSRRFVEVECGKCGNTVWKREGHLYGLRKGAEKSGSTFIPLCKRCFFKSRDELNRLKIETASEGDLVKAIKLLERGERYRAAELLSKQLAKVRLENLWAH